MHVCVRVICNIIIDLFIINLQLFVPLQTRRQRAPYEYVCEAERADSSKVTWCLPRDRKPPRPP